MAPWHYALSTVLCLVGCGTTVIDESGPTSDEGGSAGGEAPEPDPQQQCEIFALTMDTLPDCNETWLMVSCERKVRTAIERGCVAETQALLGCLARTCEQSGLCAQEEEAYLRCYGTYNG